MTALDEKIGEALGKIFPLKEGVRGYMICVSDSFTRRDAEVLKRYLLNDLPGIKFFIVKGVTEVIEV